MTVSLLPVWLADVACEIASVPAALDGATAQGVLWQAAAGRFWLEVPAVARFLVEAGRRITIDPLPGAEAAEIGRFLRMTPLAALNYQRGAMAFHAAAIAHPDGAVLLAGDSGAGKSELLANMVDRGWTMLADDLAIVDFDASGRLSVYPTFPEMVLWRNMTSSPDTDGTATDKQRCIVTAPRFAHEPLPLLSIYWLTIHSQRSIEMSEIQGAERFRIAGVLAYNSRIAAALLNRTEHFRRASALAGNTLLHRLKRPRGQWTVEELAARIVARECR